MNDFEAVQRGYSEFCTERDWDQFHTPKNLVMALGGEVGELTELFQWLTPEESAGVMASPKHAQVREEMADVLLYLLRLAEVLEVDLPAAAMRKLDSNAERYPVDRSRGLATKYTDL